MEGLIVIIIFLILIALRMPVGFSMVCVSFLYILFTGIVKMTFIPQAMVSGASSYITLAIPFFMLVGELMNTGGITNRIFKFASSCVGHITGGLGHVNVLASMIFSGMSGAAVADVAGLGNIEIDAMKKEGFDVDFAVGITAASSIIGPIIPPSTPMIIFGVAAGVSIGSLFMGGISVGILMGLFLMATVFIISKKRGYPVRERVGYWGRIKIFIQTFPAMVTPIILIGGILTGIFTPTEAAAVAVVYALILGLFIYKELKFKDILRILETGVENFGIVMLLMASGKLFGWVLGMEKVAEVTANALFALTSNKILILILINILLLFIGTFMETNASILILVPILMPIAAQLGVHPVQFGIIVVLALMIGLLTPPMAICLFITSKIGGISFERAFKAVIPYYVGLVCALILINVFPAITLTIPKLILGSSF